MKFFAFVLASMVSVSFAKIAPPNQLNIPPNMLLSGISKASFNAALDSVSNHYSKPLKSKGIRLVFKRLWNDGTVNSDTYEMGNTWTINSYGGLARYTGMTQIAFTMVACHELGHHLGGAPRYGNNTEWAAVEGEADYWASRCMKEIGFSDLQIKDASQTLASVLADLGGQSDPSPATPSKDVVKKVFEDHPEAQCRLDTYLMGNACDQKGPMSKSDPRVNACFSYPTARTYDQGSRPRCWFKP